MSTLNDLQREIHETAILKGWWNDPTNVPEKLALIHSEVSEALEEYRSIKDIPVSIHYNQSTGKPEGFPTELADIIIRVLDLAGHFGIDMDNAMFLKMEYNKTRPYRHGGKRC